MTPISPTRPVEQDACFAGLATRRALSVVLVLALWVCGGVLGGPAASAEVTHNFEFSFNGSEVPGGPFGDDLGTVAVDRASGDVYVVAYSHDAVYRFDATGKYLGEITGAAVPQGSLDLYGRDSGLAVDNFSGPNKGDLYVAGSGNGVVYKFDSTGKLLSELKGSETLVGSFTPSGIAVDESGDLYVADIINDVVDKFDASGKLVSELRSPELVYPFTIAVDSSGDVYVANEAESRNVLKVEPGGGASVLDASNPMTVAIDPGSNHIYVSEVRHPLSRIVEYDQAGSLLGAFGEGHLGAASYVNGIATNVAGEVYASDNADGLMAVFGPAVVVPDVANASVSGLRTTSATLNGNVNALEAETGEAAECQFVWGTTETLGQTAGCEPAEVKGSSPVAVQAELKEKLQPDTTYYYRLQASNKKGTNNGAESPIQKFTTAGLPAITAESATNITHTTANLEGQVNPNRTATTYHFEYGTSASYGTSVPVSPGDLGSGEVPVSVPAAELTGLKVGTTYHYRLVASNECEAGKTCVVDGSDQTFTMLPPAFIDGEFATDVSSSSATLNTDVNPLGVSTTYRLEYGTSTSYGQTWTGSVGEGVGDVLVSYHRQELSPDTTYHYRIVVHNSFGTVEGADHEFKTQLAGEQMTLPDGRSWELVSPANTKDALIQPERLLSTQIIRGAADGSAIAYEASDALGEGVVGKSNTSMVLSSRGPSGWGSEDISHPDNLPTEGSPAIITEAQTGYTYFSADLSSGLFEQGGLHVRPLAAEATERTPYLRNNLQCEEGLQACYTPLVTPGDVEPSDVQFGGNENGRITVVGATPDLSHVLLESPAALTSEAVAAPEAQQFENLYEWSAGHLQLVNILPDGKPKPGAYIGYGNQNQLELVSAYTVSSDGRRIVWSLGNDAQEGLFVRDMIAKKTLQVGRPGAIFQTMSSDGSRVFFIENGELYELNVETDAQSDLTAGHGAGEANAGVQDAILGSSEDGSYVYFVAKGVLAGDATSGDDNLYVLHDEAGIWSTTHIATLSSEDEHSWFANKEGNPELERGEVTSRVSPDGHFVTFMSERSLTGYDNTDAVGGQPDEEVYLYDAVTKHLVCASCNPTGARPVGVLDGHERLLVDPGDAWGARGEAGSSPEGEHWVAGITPNWLPVLGSRVIRPYQQRFLVDGGRLFFESPDALVPQATNGLMDVYEYEPAVGAGGGTESSSEAPSSDSCTTGAATYNERSGGCVSLISAGTAGSESMFYDASESGDDVFFLTASRLVSADPEASYHVYDARVCSVSAPCPAEPVSSPPCDSGDSCKAAPSPQPEIFGAPPSATFAGVGNLAPSPPVVKSTKKTVKCAKGKARDKHGQCVKQKSRKRKAKKGKRAGNDRRAKS